MLNWPKYYNIIHKVKMDGKFVIILYSYGSSFISMAYWTLLANKNSSKGTCKLQEPKNVINHWSASEWMKNDSFFHSH
jgi:hypothetical protein